MALLAVCLLPPYVWLARRAALRLQSNLDPYYQMWEGHFGAHRGCDWRGLKTVKLSGAEAREEEKLRPKKSLAAYEVYLRRIRTSQKFYSLSGGAQQSE